MNTSSKILAKPRVHSRLISKKALEQKAILGGSVPMKQQSDLLIAQAVWQN